MRGELLHSANLVQDAGENYHFATNRHDHSANPRLQQNINRKNCFLTAIN